MKAQLLLWFALPILLLSCTSDKQTNDGTKLLNYGYFTIRVPKSWKRVDAKGIDSYVGEIHVDTGTVVSFDLGWYSNSLSEGSEDYIIRHDSLLVRRSLPRALGSVSRVLDYRGIPSSSNIAPLTINKKQWIVVDGYKAKLVTPTHTGKGTTGIFIDSLWNAGSDTDKFQINGENLTLKQQQQLIAAIKTLKFYQHPSK
jgi:hypothetical protein